MEFTALNHIVSIEDNTLTVRPDLPPKRNMNLFYAALFLWFIYLFLVRILKVQTGLALGWFMVLLLGAVVLYYLVTFVVGTVNGKGKTKYKIQNIIAAGVVEKEGDTYAALQMQHRRFVTINFADDRNNAEAFVSALHQINAEISHLVDEA